MKLRKKLIILTIALCLPITSFANEGKDKESFNTLEMINTSSSALFDCSHYCIVGFQIRWIFIPPAKIKIFYTPVVRHNTADLMTMSAAQTVEQPWLEYRNIFGQNAKRIGDQLIIAANAKSGAKEVGGGPSQHEGFGKTQSLNFKDADVVGNPMAWVVEALGAKVKGSRGNNKLSGSNQYQNNQKKPEQTETDEASNDYLSGMSSNNEVGLSDTLNDAFQSEMFKEMVKNYPTVQMYKTMIEQIVDAFAGTMPDMVVDYYGCDSDATPFKPFYVSNIDGVLWREGYPFTDPHKSSTILNPLSKDYIKPTIGDEANDITNSTIGNIAGGMAGGWGHLYPRSGFLNSTDDYKLGAVIAARGLNIASESEQRRIRQYAGGSYESVYFQQVHPTPSTACFTNIANSIKKDDNNLKRNYAWNGWRRYQCGLTKKGGLLAEIIIGEVACIGNPPKDK